MYSVLDTELVSGTLYTNVSGIAVLAILKKPKNNRKKQVRRGTYRESENLLRSIDIW